MFGTLRRSILNCFNSSRVGPQLAHIRIAKIGPRLESEQLSEARHLGLNVFKVIILLCVFVSGEARDLLIMLLRSGDDDQSQHLALSCSLFMTNAMPLY